MEICIQALSKYRTADMEFVNHIQYLFLVCQGQVASNEL